MTGTTPNFGWQYPNSGADLVSVSNFGFVPAIDATLGQILADGGIRSIRVGTADVNAVANTVTTTPVTFASPMMGDDFIVITGVSTSVPGTVIEVATQNRTATGFDLMGYRTNDTDYSVCWLAVGIAVALWRGRSGVEGYPLTVFV